LVLNLNRSHCVQLQKPIKTFSGTVTNTCKNNNYNNINNNNTAGVFPTTGNIWGAKPLRTRVKSWKSNSTTGI